MVTTVFLCSPHDFQIMFSTDINHQLLSDFITFGLVFQHAFQKEKKEENKTVSTQEDELVECSWIYQSHLWKQKHQKKINRGKKDKCIKWNELTGQIQQ